jgi:hypothetical protein
MGTRLLHLTRLALRERVGQGEKRVVTLQVDVSVRSHVRYLSRHKSEGEGFGVKYAFKFQNGISLTI